MISVGSVIENREIISVFDNKYCLAKCLGESPEEFVVWNIDNDLNGVHTGRYYNNRMDAEWCYAALCFDWFEDNVQINMVEDELTPEQRIQLVEKSMEKAEETHIGYFTVWKNRSNIDFFKYVISVFDKISLSTEQEELLLTISENINYKYLDNISFLQKAYPIIFNIVT